MLNYNDVMHEIDRAIKREQCSAKHTFATATATERVDALILLRNELLARNEFKHYLRVGYRNSDLND